MREHTVTAARRGLAWPSDAVSLGRAVFVNVVVAVARELRSGVESLACVFVCVWRET